MIDDKYTCDVCGEDFNEDRPHYQHQDKTKAPIAPVAAESADSLTA